MSKIDLLKEKYNNITPTTFKKLVDGDTTPQKKYLEWMCIMWLQKKTFPTLAFNTTNLIEYVKEFNKLLPYLSDKDIYSANNKNYYKFQENLKNAQEKKDEKTFDKDAHVKVLEETEDYILVRPLTHRGSLKYGANTKWCTASKNRPNVFTDYIKNSILVYYNSKKTTGDFAKLAFRLFISDPFSGQIEIFDAKDSEKYENIFPSSEISEQLFAHFTMLIRTEAYNVKCQKKIKEKINNQTTTIKNLDIDFILSIFDDEKRILENQSKEEIKESLKLLEEKMSKIKI